MSTILSVSDEQVIRSLGPNYLPQGETTQDLLVHTSLLSTTGQYQLLQLVAEDLQNGYLQ